MEESSPSATWWTEPDDESYYIGDARDSDAAEYETKKDKIRVAGEETVPEKRLGKVSNTYPPVFRAKPTESYLEWRRSVEFWICGEGGHIPSELIGPRMMVQLKDRAAQLVKHLDNKDVNGPNSKDIILKALERSPLIRQLDKHRMDEHRKRLLQLNRVWGESMESYVTRADIYRSHLAGLGTGLEMGEAFYVGHLLDYAWFTKRDRAMIKTKAGSDTDEALITSAMVELAPDLDGSKAFQ